MVQHLCCTYIPRLHSKLDSILDSLGNTFLELVLVDHLGRGQALLFDDLLEDVL
jgi:hypothetical protein